MSRPDRQQPAQGKAAALPQTRREKAATARAEQAARERRRRTLIGGTAAAAALALVVGAGVAVQASRNGSDGPVAAPSGVAEGGFPVGAATAPVEVAVYEDFQCPACASFEQQTGPALAGLVEAGQATVTYHPIAFLDRASTDRYSTRALNAVACAVDSAPAAFPALHAALFAEQPAEGGPGLRDDRLVALAVEAGAPQDQVRPCVDELRFEDWTRQVTDASSRAGVDQTPTVLVDGQPLRDLSAAGLRRAVQAAASR